MNVRWTPEATQDRLDVGDTIRGNDPWAAIRIDTLFVESASLLATFPNIGRSGSLPGTREILPHESYRLIYRIDGDTVWILALIHTARQWPPETADLKDWRNP